MVKRTRRDMSDPAVKRMSQAPAAKRKSGSRTSGNAATSGGGSVYSLLIFLLICAITALLVYANWEQLLSISNNALGREPQPVMEDPFVSAGEPAEQPSSTAESGGTVTEDMAPKADKPAAETKQALQPVARRIQVEILNGCGVSGIAAKLTDFLRDRGVDVVSSGNYRDFSMQKTQIIDRAGNSERAATVAGLIGLPEANIHTKRDRNLQLDATIIIGADYQTLNAFRR